MNHPVEASLFFASSHDGFPNPTYMPEIRGYTSDPWCCDGYPVVPPQFLRGDGQDIEGGYPYYWYAQEIEPKPDSYSHQLGFDLIGIRRMWYLLDKITVTAHYVRHGHKWMWEDEEYVWKEFTATWNINYTFDIGELYYANNVAADRPARPMGQQRYASSGPYGGPADWSWDGYWLGTDWLVSDDDPDEYLRIELQLFVGYFDQQMLYQKTDELLYPKIVFYIDDWSTGNETEEDFTGNDEKEYFTYSETNVPFLSGLFSGKYLTIRAWHNNGVDTEEKYHSWSELSNCRIIASDYTSWNNALVDQVGRPVW